MPRGGYRPGAGRPRKIKAPDAKATQPAEQDTAQNDIEAVRKLLDYGQKAKAKIYKEYLVRISQGGTLSAVEQKIMDKLATDLAKDLESEKPAAIDQTKDAKLFLEDLLASPDVDRKTKIQIAGMLLPYQHNRIVEVAGKKDAKKEAAEAAAKGKYAPLKPPSLKVIGGTEKGT